MSRERNVSSVRDDGADESSTPRSRGASRAATPGRRLTARSVLLSVLLGTDPPRLPVRVLVSTTALFGIAEGTTRTALSRMVAAGELVTDDGRYALASPRLLQRQARQSASRRGDTAPWSPGDGWRQAVVVAEGRRPASERAALRSALTAARLAELREGIWLRPDNLASRPAAGTPSAWSGADEDTLVWFRTVPEEDPGALAARLWDLAGWADRAQTLADRLPVLAEPLEAGDRTLLADGFVLSAEVLRHLQADPLLPAALLPPSWPGTELRRRYDRFDAAYRAVLADWFAEHR